MIKKYIAVIYVKSILPVFSCRSFVVSGLTFRALTVLSLFLYVASGSASTSDLSVKLAAQLASHSQAFLSQVSLWFSTMPWGPNLPHSLIFKFWPTFDL